MYVGFHTLNSLDRFYLFILKRFKGFLCDMISLVIFSMQFFFITWPGFIPYAEIKTDINSSRKLSVVFILRHKI